MRLSVVVRFALLHLVLLLGVWATIRALSDPKAASPTDGSTWLFLLIALVSTFIFAWRMRARVRQPLQSLSDYAASLGVDEAERPRRLDEEDEFQDAAYGIWRLWATLTGRMASLGQEKQELRTVLDSMAESVMVTDTDGRIVLWNEAFARTFAQPSIAGSTIGSVEGRLPIEVVRSSALQDAIEEARDGKDSLTIDIEVATGRTFTVRIDRIAGIPSRGHRPLLIVFHEISALRRAQRTRRDFLANASHELRTPIATIIAAVETLEINPGLPADSHKFIEMIARQSHRMSELVEKMLRLSELEAGYEPKAEVVVLSPIVDDVFEAARTRLGGRVPQLRNEVEPELAAWVDPVACEQMLTNLVDNACKHTPASPHGIITVSGRSQAMSVELEVADTGQGMSKEHLGRIFERFYRVDSGRSREVGGTGLGLAIVRHLVLAHKGAVDVESELGKGTKFRITLPEPIR